MLVGNVGNMGNVGNVFTSNNMLVVLFSTAAVISVQGRQGETIW